MNRWVESRLPVLGVDEKASIISSSKLSVFELATGDHYYLEGAFEFLDGSGEWYLDHMAGMLYYIDAIAADSHGNIYTGEVQTGKRIQKFVPINMPQWSR